MYHFFGQKVSTADNTIIAKRVSEPIPESYSFVRLHYPDIYIPNRSTAQNIHFLPEASYVKTQLITEVDEYNSYIDRLDCIEGFRQFFIDHQLCVSRAEVEERWNTQICNDVFSLHSYIFSTNLRIVGEHLFDATFPVKYSIRINDEDILLPIGKNADSYPDRAGNIRLIWNWMNNGHDYCPALWTLLGAPVWDSETAEDPPVLYSYDAYDQFRYEAPELQLVRIFSKLENLGYIQTNTIIPESEDPLWNYYCKSDGSIDCATVDMSFLKNKLVMEQINLLLWTPEEELAKKPYFLTSSQNLQQLSAEPGSLGGHKKLKIYGRLDCPSAKRFLAKGQYAQHRVFFSDETTAISAGYRPCGVCMKEAYRKWKAGNA